MNSQLSLDLASRLKRAVSSGDATAVRRLIKGGVDLNSATFWYDGSLLHEAVAAANSNIARMLIDAKADVNARSKDGRTPLHVACRSGQEEIVQMLLDANAHVNARTKDNRSALHIALWRAHESIGLKLIEHNADVCHKDEDGTTALHWAAKTNLLACVEQLLIAGACINAADKHGRTPLHEAIVSSGNRRLVATLITGGADPNVAPKIVNTTTMTLLLNLKDCDVQRIVELLLDVGYRFTSHDRLAMTKGHIGSQVNDTLCRHLLRVPTLAHLCRLTVRRRVIASCRGQFVIDHIDRLPLPALLKDFVAFRADYALI